MTEPKQTTNEGSVTPEVTQIRTREERKTPFTFPAYREMKVKAAWIRDNVPPGKPAPGHFACECGRKVKAGFYGEGPSVACGCGLRYGNTGWIQRLLVAIAIAIALGSNAQAQLANISTRGHVGTNQEQIIAGFILDAPATVIIRGLGPTLESFGLFNTLPDPCLALYNGDRTLIAINNDWQSPQIADAQGNLTVPDFGLFAPRDSKEAALKLTLAAGQYTVVLGGFGMCQGIGLVEVYQVAR